MIKKLSKWYKKEIGFPPIVFLLIILAILIAIWLIKGVQ